MKLEYEECVYNLQYAVKKKGQCLSAVLLT